MDKTSIILYGLGAKDFANNGDFVLNNIILDDRVDWELFGQWRLRFSIPIHNPLGVTVVPEQIVKVPTPNFKEPQLFYITHVERNLETWDITAIHIYNKLKHIYLPGSLVRNKALTDAVEQLITLKGLDLPFTVRTDKPTARVDANYVRMNALQAITDEALDESVVTQTETEFTANNLEIQLLKRVGEDRGADIRYGRDLVAYAETIDVGGIVGRVVPVGEDGFTIPDSYGGPFITCDGYDPLIHQTKAVSYPVIADAGENAGTPHALPVSEAVRQLKRLGEREFTLGNIHQPLVSYTIGFIGLDGPLSGLQDIRPGDAIRVIDNTGKEICERVIGYTYQPSTQKYMGLSLANKAPAITAGERAKRIHGGGTSTL